ncbi:hypothetical protein [Zunongwangia sp. HRR-M8]|uniref:hypothetical protein n=1 Tax=Zunongwangia sp. HRR-M8 TaxID=3015170 RepID=UPI0022DD40D9|nr:hypothetical protein [Zunongwangia sp. HRR-M8]WBL21236.1 hypothetical protein PBT89_10870 [Zunongwangia sp. HRR-M8]
MIKKLSILALTILLFSCSDDDDGIKVNFDDFEAIPEEYPFSDINPETPISYFEYIQTMPDYEDPDDPNSIIYRNTILFSFGETCSDVDCKTAFNELQAEEGFNYGCLPGYCFSYIKYQRQEDNFLVTSKEDVLNFLGEISTPGEALLVARANGYYWAVDDKNNGAYKQVEDGFELIVRQTVKFCEPVQTDRFYIKISADGTISILKQEVAEVLENACV